MKNGTKVSLIGIGVTIVATIAEVYKNGLLGVVFSNIEMVLLGLILAVLGVIILIAEQMEEFCTKTKLCAEEETA